MSNLTRRQLLKKMAALTAIPLLFINKVSPVSALADIGVGADLPGSPSLMEQHQEPAKRETTSNSRIEDCKGLYCEINDLETLKQFAETLEGQLRQVRARIAQLEGVRDGRC